eukprot:g30721.t1
MRDPLRAVLTVARVVYLYQALGGFFLGLIVILGWHSLKKGLDITMVCLWGLVSSFLLLYDTIGTVQGAIRLLLLLQPTPTVKASEARGWAVQAILQDLQKCTEWWLVMETRSSMPQVNGQMAPIAWVAHSGFEARKVAPFASLTSLVVLLRDYAQLWLRQKRSARAEPMNDFVGEYLGNLDPVPRVKAAGGTTLVLYFDELFGSESLPLPQSLLDLLSLGSPDLEQMTSLRSSISQLSLTCDAWFGVCAFFSSSDGSIHVNHLLPAPSVPGGEDGEPSVPRFPFCPSQDEFESRPDCAAPCRNLKVAYAKSKHPQPSAPREVSPEDLPEIYQLEELLCATMLGFGVIMETFHLQFLKVAIIVALPLVEFLSVSFAWELFKEHERAGGLFKPFFSDGSEPPKQIYGADGMSGLGPKQYDGASQYGDAQPHRHGQSQAELCMLLRPLSSFAASQSFPSLVALWLQSLGLAAYILRFRLRTEGHFWPAQLEDGLEALRLIGEEVAKRPKLGRKWTIDYLVDVILVIWIGVLGFSAGGHLASVLATHHPHLLAFHILIYGSTDVETPAWDPWLTRLGYPGIDFNTVKAVNAQTPPLFAAVSTEDEIASYDAWAEEDQWGYHYASGRPFVRK